MTCPECEKSHTIPASAESSFKNVDVGVDENEGSKREDDNPLAHGGEAACMLDKSMP
jgi:hypothetical protein